MYEAINNRVIVKREAQQTTASGIIVDTDQTQQPVLELEVVATTELTKQLQGKTILAERRHVSQLSDDDKVYYGAIKYEDILAIQND